MLGVVIMKKILCVVKHSESKTAWNITGSVIVGNYKIARIPYIANEGNNFEISNTIRKFEALEIANFICYCLNNADKIKPN